MPASWKSQSNSTPVASSTRRVASASSGPVPSPGMKVTWCAIRRLILDKRTGSAATRGPGGRWRRSGSGLGPLLRVAQPGNQGLEQRPRYLGVLLHEGAKLPRGHPPAAEIGGRDDRRRAGAVVDQRYLSEVIAGAQRAHDRSLDAYRGVSALDHEEAHPTLALGGDRVTLGEGPLGHPVGEPPQLLGLDPREERDAPQRLGDVRHQRYLTQRLAENDGPRSPPGGVLGRPSSAATRAPCVLAWQRLGLVISWRTLREAPRGR